MALLSERTSRASSPLADHPHDHDAFDARRRADAHAAPAGGTPGARPTWRHVAAVVEQATAGADTVDVAIALRLVLMLENVECRPK